MKDLFIQAIRELKKVRVTFYSKEDGGFLCRECAPMDYGPSSRAHDKSDRFHMWDYESDKKAHTLSLLPDQIKSMEAIEENFDPSSFISWTPNWIVSRDWGKFS